MQFWNQEKSNLRRLRHHVQQLYLKAVFVLSPFPSGIEGELPAYRFYSYGQNAGSDGMRTVAAATYVCSYRPDNVNRTHPRDSMGLILRLLQLIA